MSRNVAITIRKLSAGGGLEKYASRISKGFLDRGDRVTILTTGNASVPGCTIVPIKLRSHFAHRKMVEFDTKCGDWTSHASPDIVFAMDRTTHQTHLRAGNGCHAAYLEHCPHRKSRLHNTVLAIEKKAFESPHLRRLFTNSHMVKNEILHHYKTDPDTITVIHNGVEWHELERSFMETPPRSGPYHFLFVGHGFDRKGLAPLLHALVGIRCRLSVVGKDKKLAAYTKLAHKLGIDATFYGATHAIPLYQQADALVIPSLYDPFANVTVEALAMGLTVVSSKTNGGHEVLTPENGIIIDDLKEALERAATRPKTKASATAVRESVRHLDFSNQITKLIEACDG